MGSGREKVGLDFVFDTRFGESALKSLFRGFHQVDRAQNRAEKSAANYVRASGGFGKSAGMLKNLATQALGTAAGMVGFQAISGILSNLSSQVPFIGIAFQTMGRTIQTNLIWPLVKDLLPILQRMTHWVRDNRLKFVALGTVLLNVFRGGMTVGKAFFGTLKAFAGGFFGAIGKGQLTFRSMIDFFNLMLLKTVFALVFLEMLISPVVGKMGAAFGNIWKNAVSPFLSGLMGGLAGMMPVLMEGSGLLERIFGDIAGGAGTALPILKSLGEFIGVGIVDNIRNLIGFAGALYDGVIKPLFSGIMAGLGGSSASGMQFISALQSMRVVARSVFGGMLKGIRALAPVFRFAGYVLGKYWSGWIKVISGGYNTVLSVGRFFVKTLPESVSTGVDRAKKYFMGLFDGAKEKASRFMRDLLNTIWKAPLRAASGFIDNLRGKFGSMRKSIQELPNMLNTMFTEANKKLKESPFGKMFTKLMDMFGRLLPSKPRPAVGSNPGEPKRKPIKESTAIIPDAGKPSPVFSMSGGASVAGSLNLTDNSTYHIEIKGDVSDTQAREMIEKIEKAKERSHRRLLLQGRLGLA